jgi:bifunctional UDP-N-acetylglucosamine pyrophosphorylase/glucosamine-1-phosphate N-acetyltransferase
MKKNGEKSQRQIIKKLKKTGVEIVGNDIYISPQAVIERGVKIHSPAHICGATHIYEGAEVCPYSYVENATIGKNAKILASCVTDSAVGEGTSVGPYANLRDNASVGNFCRIGDFVEIKRASLSEGCKVAHLAYVGDASLGKRVNVGCGAVFANFDGKAKHMSVIEDDCFIGCNCNIVAPVHMQRGAYIAAGTTLTHNLSEDDLCVGRCRERVIERGAIGRYKRD